jgi:hypothetical protein
VLITGVGLVCVAAGLILRARSGGQGGAPSALWIVLVAVGLVGLVAGFLVS